MQAGRGVFYAQNRWEHHQVSGLRGFGGFRLVLLAERQLPRKSPDILTTDRRTLFVKAKVAVAKYKGSCPYSDDGYLAFGTGLQGSGFLSRPHTLEPFPLHIKMRW